jgi:hypothetical protein
MLILLRDGRSCIDGDVPHFENAAARHRRIRWKEQNGFRKLRRRIIALS